jgi:hypothetical protein
MVGEDDAAVGGNGLAQPLHAFSEKEHHRGVVVLAATVLATIEEIADRIEADARATRAASPTVDVVVGNAMARAEDSPNARAFKRMWQAWRSRKVDSPRQWCLNVLASDQAPDEFKRFAEDSLALMDPEREKRGKYWFEEER